MEKKCQLSGLCAFVLLYKGGSILFKLWGYGACDSYIETWQSIEWDIQNKISETETSIQQFWRLCWSYWVSEYTITIYVQTFKKPMIGPQEIWIVVKCVLRIEWAKIRYQFMNVHWKIEGTWWHQWRCRIQFQTLTLSGHISDTWIKDFVLIFSQCMSFGHSEDTLEHLRTLRGLSNEILGC